MGAAYSFELSPDERRDFDSIEALRAWGEDQFTTWNGIRSRISEAGHSGDAGRIVEQAIDDAQVISNQARSLSGGEMTDDLRRRITGWLKRPWHTETRVMKWVDRIRTNYPPDVLSRFLICVAGFHGERPHQEGGQALADALAVCYRESVVGEGDYQPIVVLHQRSQVKFDDFTTKSDEAFSEYTSMLTALEQGYAQVKSFNEPKSYWEGRAMRSGWIAVIAFAAFLLVGCAGVVGLILHAELVRLEMVRELLLANLNLAKTTTATTPTWQSVIYFLRQSFPLIVETAALFWVLRLIVRIALTQMHQHTDATERVVMVQTYLALLLGKGTLNGTSGIPSDQAKIVLEALFRHGTTGLFQDDASPSLPLAQLAPAAKPVG